MKRFKYSEAMLNFLELTFQTYTCRDTTVRFNAQFNLNKTPEQIKSAVKNHGIIGGRRKVREPKKIYSPEQIEFIQREYQQHSVKALTNLFNNHFGLTETQDRVKGFISREKITCGRTGHFDRGHVPHNAGKTGMPVHPNSKKTQFKKGHVSTNTRALGAQRICSKDGFILIKGEEENPYTGHKTRFKHKQIVVWEQHNGPVPENHCVRFLDGDKLNCDIDNLTIVSRALNLHLNQFGYNNAPDELKPSMMALCELRELYFKKRRKRSKGDNYV